MLPFPSLPRYGVALVVAVTHPMKEDGMMGDWERVPSPDRFYVSHSAGAHVGRPVDWTITRGDGNADGTTYASGTDVLVTLDRGKRWRLVEGTEWFERFGWRYRQVELRNPRGRAW